MLSYSKFVWSGIVYNLFKEEWESKKGAGKGKVEAEQMSG